MLAAVPGMRRQDPDDGILATVDGDRLGLTSGREAMVKLHPCCTAPLYAIGTPRTWSKGWARAFQAREDRFESGRLLHNQDR